MLLIDSQNILESTKKNKNRNKMQSQQITEQFLEKRYNESLYQLKCALNLSHIPIEIPSHVLVCKAVALLRFQFNELNRIENKYLSNSPWDHPKYNNDNNNNKQQQQQHKRTKKLKTYHHDTRHFYNKRPNKYNKHENKKNGFNLNNSSQFCPTIGFHSKQQESSSILPPLPEIDWNDDNQQNQQTSNVKSEFNTNSNSTTMDTTNEFSSEWDYSSSAYSMLDDEDIEFDIPLQFQSDFII